MRQWYPGRSIARAEILTKAKEPLEKGLPVRSLEFTPEERKTVRSLGLITAKKVLYVCNVAEDDLEGKSPAAMKVRERAAKEGGGVVPVCGKLEAELAELPDADRAEMLSSMGLKEPALASLSREAYRLMGLQSYFTAGPMEIKAWTIPVGATAPQAAGVIHTDFERGFIRAEIYTLADLEKYKTEAAIRAAGKLRAEGKAYIMHDGDITHFLFTPPPYTPLPKYGRASKAAKPAPGKPVVLSKPAPIKATPVKPTPIKPAPTKPLAPARTSIAVPSGATPPGPRSQNPREPRPLPGNREELRRPGAQGRSGEMNRPGGMERPGQEVQR